MNISCQSPVVLLNPKFFELLRTEDINSVRYVTDDECNVISYKFRPWAPDSYRRFLSPKRNKVTLDNYSNYQIVTKDYVIYPLYIVVPCGKCLLCRNRASLSWQCRALAETCCSSNIPLFVTLTFDNEHKPLLGVEKRDIQLFLKRLRKNLKDSNIRYFCVSEYGSHTYRPHYHMIIWNWPTFKHLSEPLKEIEKAWQQGFVYVKACNQGAVSYVMKYMRKDAKIPVGMNDTFYLASRRPGIGAEWIEKNKKFFQENPEQVEVSLRDPFTGNMLSFFLPQYFKDKISPPVSKLFSRSVVKEYKRFVYLSLLAKQLVEPRSYMWKTFEDDWLSPVLKKYYPYFGFKHMPDSYELPEYKGLLVTLRKEALSEYFSLQNHSVSEVLLMKDDFFGRPISIDHIARMLEPTMSYDQRLSSFMTSKQYWLTFFVAPLYRELMITSKVLMEVKENASLHISYQRIRDLRASYYERKYAEAPKIDIGFRVLKLQREIASATCREIF